ncbi:vWA domain-containing protein [Dyadobacter bucti]|uniref:vWA domain-containing protein n=1 Tax=Dyadobacter bucti TaxID=2572203 RepID=UPI001E516571|nr:VWA domain-containing protein [Dyadobacter bucti]
MQKQEYLSLLDEITNSHSNMEFSTESPQNYETKCCCVLVLDVSSSMAGAPIEALNKSIHEFYNEISSDPTTANRLEISIVEFSSTVKTLVDPSLVEDFTMPTLITKGTTALVDGVKEGIEIVKSRKAWYRKTGQPYYRPWIILITDGEPDKGQDLPSLSIEIKQLVSKKELFFLALGVQGANMSKLAQLSDIPPAELQGLKFSAFFEWLSASMIQVTNSKDDEKIDLPNPASWMKGFTV